MSYIQGFVIPVPIAKKEEYRELAAKAAPIFTDYGATRIVETWGVDLPDGKVTDFRMSVQATADENVVFSWIVWPDKETCDAAQDKIMKDERMTPDGPMPFDGKRMVYGGFETILDTDC